MWPGDVGSCATVLMFHSLNVVVMSIICLKKVDFIQAPFKTVGISPKHFSLSARNSQNVFSPLNNICLKMSVK
jgi:hypothetical protein